MKPKTKSLLAGMVFHFLHDAFLFVVQLDQGIVFNPTEAFIFYGCLFVSVGLGIVVTNLMTRKYDMSKNADPMWV